jgi:hypothetical protein
VGLVSDYLWNLVVRQIKESGLVVWFDPEEHYREFVEDLSLPDAAVEVCVESFFELRHRVEPHLDGDSDSPPRLLVYIPRGEEGTRDALVELTAPGAVMKPGEVITRNTRLSVVAKTALRPVLGADHLAQVEKDVSAGRMTLDELDNLTTSRPGVVSLIFGTAYPQDVALKFLGTDQHDPAVEEKEAVPDLALLLGEKFRVSLPPDATCDELRAALARHVLSTEFVRSIPEPLPSRLSSVNVAREESAVEACVSLAHQWRNRLDLKESYARHADRVEGELGVRQMDFALEQVRDCHTFAAVESALQTAIEEWALEKGSWTAGQHQDLRQVIEKRLQGFWASWPERYEEIQPRWRLVQAAIEVIHTADDVEAGLKTLAGGPAEILERYAGGLSAEDPWCELDTHHRRLERRNLELSPAVKDEHPALERLITHARQRYREAAETLSERFLDALQEARFEISGLPRQTETFSRHVEPALKGGEKVAYLLVDALRYDMARELAQTLEHDHDLDLSVAVGTVPTITEIGMAALMPGAESGARVVPVSEGRLGLEVDGNVLRDRKDRVKYLKEWASRASKTVHETKLEDLYAPTRATKTSVKGADLVFATSQEIDEQGELGNVATARRFMDDVLFMLPRAIKVLADLGCQKVVLAADHGYVFADELDTDTKIDPPGGQTNDLHRRVWIGIGGSDEASFVRFPLSRLDLSDELHVAVPRGLGGFKAPGGAVAYFHGGMSPQEISLPVISLSPARTAGEAAATADVEWEIKLGSAKIATRIISVRVGGRSTSLLDPALPRVRVEVRSGGAVVSEPLMAAYDYSEASRDFGMNLGEGGALEENTVTMQIEPGESQQAGGVASVHLLDAATGVELARLDGVEMDISV